MFVIPAFLRSCKSGAFSGMSRVSSWLADWSLVSESAALLPGRLLLFEANKVDHIMALQQMMAMSKIALRITTDALLFFKLRRLGRAGTECVVDDELIENPEPERCGRQCDVEEAVLGIICDVFLMVANGDGAIDQIILGWLCFEQIPCRILTKS